MCAYPAVKTVILVASIRRNVSGGLYEVTKQLPYNGHEFEYHIKSANEKRQRVARERELTKVEAASASGVIELQNRPTRP
jgi:hypothetical protein